MFKHSHSALLVLLATAPAVSAQYRWEANESLGVEFRVHKKLKPVPMKLGSADPHLRARFEPDNEGDYIYGRYGKFAWQLYLYEFDPRAAATPVTGEAAAKPKSEEEAKKAAEAAARARIVARDFHEWVKVKDRSRSKRKFFVEAKAVKGGTKKLGYALWEYSDGRGMRDARGKQFELRWYRTAAVYDVGGKQIALLVVLPVKRGNKPDRKYMTLAKKMVGSLRLLGSTSSAAAGGPDRRDSYAKSKTQKAALAKLKKNIADFDNWDYFTTPSYIITYSWDKPRKRVKAKAFAKRISDRLEEIRSKFLEHYPPHPGQAQNYSVIRVCADYDDFTKYGGTPGGVVGWFSPGSKELCVFYDTDKRFGDENYIIGVCYHEAWHQYADAYWPKTTLHRWFDEGLAEYFGSWRLRGRTWKFEYHRGRFDAIRRQINEKTFVASREIVAWPRSKFYGKGMADHYAQAWAMVDMLMRGKKKLGKRWNPTWSEILKRYGDIAMKTKDGKKAVEAAFQGIDFDKFETAWKNWVKSGRIKKM